MKPLSVEDGTQCKTILTFSNTRCRLLEGHSGDHVGKLTDMAAPMNTKGVEDGIVCEFCGTHCYQGAEHNARVEDNARFNDPQPAVPVEERTASCLHKYGPRITGGISNCLLCSQPKPTSIPEERTAEMEELMASFRAAAEKVVTERSKTPKCMRCGKDILHWQQICPDRDNWGSSECEPSSKDDQRVQYAEHELRVLLTPENILKLLDHKEPTV